MIFLARFFHLATWHAALAITKGHFIEATGSACLAVDLVIVKRFAVSPSLLLFPYLPVIPICLF
jgi:hypothetical protein